MVYKLIYHFRLGSLRLYLWSRGLKYVFFSTAKVQGKIIKNQPVHFAGKGKIISEGRVNIGVVVSPGLINGYSYLDARKPDSVIRLGDGVWLNNNAVIICDGGEIAIGKNTIAGPNLEIFDSDFHNLDPGKRTGTDYDCKDVRIGENVFIGSGVKILKGVVIGDNSVIGSGSVVVKSIPSNVLAAGNPAKVIRTL